MLCSCVGILGRCNGYRFVVDLRFDAVVCILMFNIRSMVKQTRIGRIFLRILLWKHPRIIRIHVIILTQAQSVIDLLNPEQVMLARQRY